jgi:tetraacyldisaccharide 4'-kinase
VISVGNLTTGGTGKTPVVCFLANWFRNRGVRVAIVSRGYGRSGDNENDEALELHWRLPDVPHVQDPDRVDAARVAVEELETEVILMDDGFQHRRLHRDLDIIVIDATCPFGYGHLLPRGLLREPVHSLRRADLVMITRCDAVSDAECAKIDAEVQKYAPSIPICRSVHRPTCLLQYPNQSSPIDAINGCNVGVISAIGNPQGFEATLRDCGATIVDSRRLADHDPYGPDTVADLRAWVEQLGDRIDRVVCTHKDLVKLRTDRIGGKTLAALLVELQIQGERGPIEDALSALERVP